MLRREFEKKERKAAVKVMFASDEEATSTWGYTGKVLKFMTKSIKSY
jgi:hypothetical protein